MMMNIMNMVIDMMMYQTNITITMTHPRHHHRPNTMYIIMNIITIILKITMKRTTITIILSFN